MPPEKPHVPKPEDKYPDLIDLTPSEQLRRLPPIPDWMCGRRVRTCSLSRGGCGRRYKKGEKTWVCPKCGADRRCRNKKIQGGSVCRMHGGKSMGTPRTGRYMPPSIYLKNYNRVMGDHKLIKLAEEIGMLISYNQQLWDTIDTLDVITESRNIETGLAMITQGVADGSTWKVRRGLSQAKKAYDKVWLQFRAWQEIRSNLRLMKDMMDSQHKWLVDEQAMVPRQHVLEALVWFNRIALRFIRTPEDKRAYGEVLLSNIPRIEVKK
jgi:hypothetical protein